MGFGRAAVLTFTLIFFFTHWAIGQNRCSGPESFLKIRTSDSAYIYLIFYLPVHVLHTPINPETYSEAFNQHSMEVLKRTSTNPLDLLIRQRRLYQKHFGDLYTPRYDKILLGEAGFIRKIRCLEMLLFETHFQLQRENPFESEYGAWVMESQDFLKIHFISSPVASVPLLPELKSQLSSDINNLSPRNFFNVHNHPFFLRASSSGDIAGTLIPSGNSEMGDLAMYRAAQRSWGLQKAWITNGFHTLELDSGDWNSLD